MMTDERAKHEADARRKAAQGGIASETLTVRDYFAAKAMQKLILNHYPFDEQHGARVRAEWARGIYQIADAMLKAREA
jgi:hypothetical protein